MAGTLKRLLVVLGIDAKDFDEGADDAERRTKNLEGSFDNLSRVGAGILMGAAAGIAAGTAALVSTIGPATDLEESINAVNVVFGDSADDILAFGENSAMAVGLSSREFGQLSAEMGAMLGNVGIAEDKLAGETINLVERASDMASIFNTDVPQAFNAIQSAIKGEFNPLEQFGVKMNQAMITARGLEMGLADANGELTDSAKAQAALAILYEQTDKVAGDFQNTSDGLANSQRQLAAILENTKAKVGAALTPALAELAGMIEEIAASPEFADFLDGIIAGVGVLAEWISTSVPVMIENFRKFTDWLANNKAIVVGVLAAMGVAVIAFGISVATAAWAALAPMLPVIAIMLAVAAVAALAYMWWEQNWEKIKAVVAGAVEFIMEFIEKIRNMDWQELGRNILQGIADGIKTAAIWLVEAAVNAAKAALDAVKDLLGIESPSTVFAGLGANMMLGMAEGIGDYASVPVGVSQDVTADITAPEGRPDQATFPGGAGQGLDESKLARMLRDAMLQVIE